VTEPPVWTRRFTAPEIAFPVWCDAAPDRLAFLSNESGIWQAWTLDLATGERAQLTDEPVGVETLLAMPDGRMVWWQDDSGDEQGRWIARPFDGGEPAPLVPEAPTGWALGISFGGGTIAVGVGTDDDYRIWCASRGQPGREIRRSASPLGVGALDTLGVGGVSADGRTLIMHHTEHGDIVHRALQALDVRDGRTIAGLRDEGRNLEPVAWSPVPGDERLLFTSERGPFERPAIWRPRDDARTDVPLDLPGAGIALGWWPDGSTILVRHEFEARFELYRVDPTTGAAEQVAAPVGEIGGAAVRPDGRVWDETSDTENPARILDTDGAEVLVPPGERPPAGHPSRSFWFRNPHGDPIQAILLTPPETGPFPTVMSVHGGPEWHERNAYEAETLAFVDAGYAVALVNYRGSTGYGVAFRNALIGNPWFAEMEDVIAGLDALIDAGIADPDRVAFAGWSWGGCLACLAAGLHPDRWKAVFAGIPSGDLVAAHHACMPELKAYDLALYGGGPEELPDMWAERNPMTYVDRVRAPALVIAGENDPRCPPEGIVPWVEAVRARGIVVDAHFYPEGHHANGVEAQVHHMDLILDFFARYV
jgi:dipeptidyl aminopeptidase/acylaminoacyl peptidase